MSTHYKHELPSSHLLTRVKGKWQYSKTLKPWTKRKSSRYQPENEDPFLYFLSFKSAPITHSFSLFPIPFQTKSQPFLLVLPKSRPSSPSFSQDSFSQKENLLSFLSSLFNCPSFCQSVFLLFFDYKWETTNSSLFPCVKLPTTSALTALLAF